MSSNPSASSGQTSNSTRKSSKLQGPRLSALPEPATKSTQKKRSKSLGGAALEQLRANNLTDTLTFELTPRKKARRSLLPGKSILKSRPTLTGLERTTSDNTLTSTLSLITQLPSRATSTGPEVPPQPSQPNNQSEPVPSNSQIPQQDPSQANPADEPNKLESNAPDNSSDMDMSDDQELNRNSLGSNTTNLLRRVSFAAKAHVRTFGSPIVDPDCSTTSSNASNVPNQPALGSSSLPDENSTSEGEHTADMSIDNSFSNPRPDALLQSIGTRVFLNPQQLNPPIVNPPQPAPPPRNQHKSQKPSRLSTAIGGFGTYDDDDDEEEEEEEAEKGNLKSNQDAPKQLNAPPSTATKDPIADPSQSSSVKTTLDNQVIISQENPDRSQDMDITTPFQPIPTNTIHTQQQQKPTDPLAQRVINPVVQSGIPRPKPSSNDQQRPSGLNKSSRLSSVLPEYLQQRHPEDETENVDDTLPSNPQPTSQAPTNAATIKSQQNEVNQILAPAQKLSRLSLAFPEYMHEDDAEETSNPQPLTSHQSTADPPGSSNHTNQNQTAGSQDQQLNNNKQSQKPKKSSRITNFLGVSEETDDEDEGRTVPDKQHQVDGSTQPAGQSSSSSQEIPGLVATNSPEGRSAGNTQTGTGHSAPNNKPSGLTELFSERGEPSGEVANGALVDGPVSPQALKVTSEPISKKHRSRISEFLQPAEESAEDIDEGNLALIDFEDRPTGYNGGLGQKRRSMSISGFQPSLQEQEDLMDISFEYRTHAERTAMSRISNSAPGGVLPDSQSTVRVDSLPNTRLSFEPRLSSIRNFIQQQQQITSASPSRRLSGSRSGASPRKNRFAFASPRRSSTAPLTLNSNPARNENGHQASLPPLGSTHDIGSSSLTQEIRYTSAELDPRRDAGVVDNAKIPTTVTTKTSQIPPTLPPPPPTPPATISLNEFLEQAEIKFISLSQPRVRNHDHQDNSQNLNIISSTSSFSEQIFAGMVKIPKLRLLESSSRNLKQKTEILDLAIQEHESIIERNSTRYKILKEWMNLQERKKKISTTQMNENQKDLEELNSLMNRLRLSKNLVELGAKRDSLLFEIDMAETYQSNLHIRIAKLNQDLEMMRKMETNVKPLTHSLQERKLDLIKSIQTRKLKMAEIESCDQNKLKALKVEAKELLTETEANRRALAESEFEKNLWLAKFSELEQERIDHVKKIEEMKLDPNQTQKLNVQELVRLKDEFEILQSLMGWKLVKFEEKLIEFNFLNRMRVIFHLDSFKSPDQHLNVSRVELDWIQISLPDDPIHSNACQVDQHHLVKKYQIQSFFFHRLKSHYLAKKRLSGRVREFVHEISSIWNHARELTYEIMNVGTRFTTKINQQVSNQPSSSSSLTSSGVKNGSSMELIVMIRSRSKHTCVDAHFSFDGQEILDWKSSSPISHLSCTVSCAFGNADCLNLSYIISECLDRGQRGGLKEACLEALNSLES